MSENITEQEFEKIGITKEWLQKNKKSIEKFAQVNNSENYIQLLNDISRDDSRTFSTLSKTELRTYLKNPILYKKQLREMSQFLYRVSYEYRRMIRYLAGMFCSEIHSIIPNIDINEEIDEKTMLENYNLTLAELEKFDLAGAFFKALVIAWREDVVYCLWLTDGEKNLIEPFDGGYGKIVGVNYDSTLIWAMDMSYFQRRTEILPTYGSIIEKMYRNYEKDSSMRWQIVPPEAGFALKIDMEDPLLPYPPLAALFASLIDLADLQQIQSVKDQASIYRLLVARLNTATNSEAVDDFTIDLDTAIGFFNKMTNILPEWVSAVLSPMEVDSIDLYRNEADDVNSIADAAENIFANCGGQVLNTSSISTSSGLENSLIADTNYALSSVVPQIECIINKWLTIQLGDKACKVKFYKVSQYTLKQFKATIKENATLGLPNRLLLNTLNGLDEKETLALNTLETDVLRLDERFIPMQTSYTQSNEIESNEKDATDLTDEGAATRDKDKNNK